MEEKVDQSCYMSGNDNSIIPVNLVEKVFHIKERKKLCKECFYAVFHQCLGLLNASFLCAM